jgi:glutaminyl-tRNA synthetase
MGIEKSKMTDTPDKSPDDKGQSPLATNFVRDIIDEHNRTGRFEKRVHTRFPPEPNGYLHIGHAKAICLNFGIAKDYGGLCNLRFDDTNPSKEETEYVDSIMEDVRWLGFDWEDRLYYASDYFEQLYLWAEKLITMDKAYVCDLNATEMREYRGTLTEPGKESPYRNRSVDENLDLFRRMRAGEFPDGFRTLRAKIDMASGNLNMRDPVIYRILRATHHRTGDKWCIYPMYDYTHCLSDSIEKITHSICTLEFEDHRPLYDWCIDQLDVYHPQQIEFAKLQLTYTMMSKRNLRQLVEEKLVSGWDDPRMPTLSGFRRRGYTPESIRLLADRVGVAKRDSSVEIGVLEDCIREDLNKKAPRKMAVLRPLKLVIDNYPEGKVEEFETVNNPEDPSVGSRKLPFSKVIYIEQDDFREEPPKGYHRLFPGSEVRLKGAYFVKCINAAKNSAGEITEIHCTYDPDTHGGEPKDGRKVKGTIHWVSAAHAVDAEVRLYDYLFLKEDPGDVAEGETWKNNLNPDALVVVRSAKIEASIASATSGDKFQFLRHGYFCIDTADSKPGALVFNRTVSLKDSWAKIEKGQKKG